MSRVVCIWKGLPSNDIRLDCFKAAFYFQHAINTGNGDMEARYQLDPFVL